MYNADIKAKLRYFGIEWEEIAIYLKIPMKDLVRRLNEKEATPIFRRKLYKAIESISQRPEDFYDEYTL